MAEIVKNYVIEQYQSSNVIWRILRNQVEAEIQLLSNQIDSFRSLQFKLFCFDENQAKFL